MVTRVLATQISTIWESIKFATVQVGGVEKSDYQFVFNYLFRKLLDDKMQCWVRLSEERKILTLAITEIQIDKIKKDKILIMHALYSWRLTDNDQWVKNFAPIMEFAKKQQCKQFVFESGNPRIWEITESWGFKENNGRFTLELL